LDHSSAGSHGLLISHHLTAFPAEAIHVALYLQYLAEAKNSKAAVEEAVNGLARAHLLAGVPSPTDLPIVRSTLGDLRRKLAKPVIKKHHSQ